MAVPVLSVPLVLESKLRQPDEMGGYQTIWQALGMLHAHLDSGGGRLRGGEAGPQSVVAWKITVRAFPAGDVRRPIAGQRLRLGMRIFHVEAVAEADPAARYLTIVASEE